MKKKSAPQSRVEQIRELARREDELMASHVRYDRYNLPNPPSDEYFAALDALFAAYDKHVLPFPRALMAKWAEVIQEARKFGVDYSANDFEAVHAWARIYTARDAASPALFLDPPPLPPLMTPTAMHMDGSNLKTIANELRWKHPISGLPDLARVSRELEHPGTEYNEAAIRERETWHWQQLGWLIPPEEIDNAPAPTPIQREPADVDVSDLLPGSLAYSPSQKLTEVIANE